MRRILLVALATGLATAPHPTTAQDRAAGDDEVVEVRMVERSPTRFVFEPAHIEVAPGTVVRFVQEGAQPHNVEFRETPHGAALGSARMGPFLLRAGEAWEVTIDDRFVPGLYPYVCTPHEAMGMTGEIAVVSGGLR